MKRWSVLIVLCLFLSGCSAKNDTLSEIITFRDLIQKQSFQFEAEVTADYVNALHQFRMLCSFDNDGGMVFTIMEPESISQITGTVSNEGGALTFDDKILAFEMLADGQITPVSAPWILIKALRGGYIHGSGETDEGILAQIDDSYADDAFRVDVQFTDEIIPQFGEILWQGRRILGIEIENFTFV